jgi:hypothetical protein
MMSFEAIKAAQAAAAARKAEEAKQNGASTSSESSSKKAHELALEQGIPVAKALSLKKLFLKNGQEVKPTAEGYFIALNEEIATQLEYFSKQYNKVEIITPPAK